MEENTEKRFSHAEQKAVIMRLREELARRRLSRAQLAEAAVISLSSLEKSLAGQRPFSEEMLTKLEAALSIRLRCDETATQTAPDALGNYARGSVSWIEGVYLTARPASTEADAIFTYGTLISWDGVEGHLMFREIGRKDEAYAQFGPVALPQQSGHVYLHTNRHGQHRLAILNRVSRSGEMQGLLLTLQQGRGAALHPISMPIILLPMRNFSPEPRYGLLKAGDKLYDELRAKLDRTLGEGFAEMIR